MNGYLRMASLAAAVLTMWRLFGLALLVLLLPTQNARATVVHTGEIWRVDSPGVMRGTIVDYFVYGIGDTLPGGPSVYNFHADWEGPVRKDFCSWCPGATGPDTSNVIIGIQHGGLSGGGRTAFIGDTNGSGDYHLIYMIISNIIGDADIQMNGGWTKLAPVPLPASLPMFLAALGVFGLLGWRRKRRAALAA
jgi:PEP-CTERM motif